MQKVMIILAMLIAMQPYHAIGQSGARTIGELTEDCKAFMANDTSQGYPFYCAGLIQGAMATLYQNCEYRKEGHDIPQTHAMGGANVPGAGIIQGFINWAEENPELSDVSAIGGVVVALPEIFPCEK